MPYETQGFQIIRNLFTPQHKQHLEWSIRLTKATIQLRHKPTIYTFINNECNIIEKLRNSLINLKCPQEVIGIFNQNVSNMWYLGLRVPEHTRDDKVIYIHNNLVNYIHAYRWKNSLEYRKLKYVYNYNLSHQMLSEQVHSNLKPAFCAVLNSPELKNKKGVWTQECDELNELYLTFNERPKLKLVTKALKSHIYSETYKRLEEFEGLGFKNIGFDCTKINNPEITIYFSIPINTQFPENYLGLIGMTHEYFNKI